MIPLSNEWIEYVKQTYSQAIGYGTVIVRAILKIIVVLNPNIPSNKIRDIFMNFREKKPMEFGEGK